MLQVFDQQWKYLKGNSRTFKQSVDTVVLVFNDPAQFFQFTYEVKMHGCVVIFTENLSDLFPKRSQNHNEEAVITTLIAFTVKEIFKFRSGQIRDLKKKLSQNIYEISDYRF